MDFVKYASLKIRESLPRIREWEESHLKKILPPFYCSADIRVSYRKAAVVDTNIFPAGFNNLSAVFRSRLGSLLKETISIKHPGTEKLLIVPEIHTRNPHYWENVKTLEQVLSHQGFGVRVGFVDENIRRESISAVASGGGDVKVFNIRREGSGIAAGDFVPDAVLLNNDFSDDCPSILRDITQPVLPPVEIGWHSRRKDVHFQFYNSLACEAASVCGIDPNTITVETRLLEGVDFDEPASREDTARTADEMIEKIARWGGENPFLFLKSNSGTYGMAVVSVRDGDQVRNMNAGNRKKMRAGKSKIPSAQVVIQEGIETALETSDGLPAEPVLYMVETEVAGAFYRANSKKSGRQNLNSAGMEFRQFPDGVSVFQEIPELLSLCAKIAVIAAGYEIEKVMLEGGCD